QFSASQSLTSATTSVPAVRSAVSVMNTRPPRLDRRVKSGRWPPSQARIAGQERVQLGRRGLVELVVGAVPGRLVVPPPQQPRSVAEPPALEVLVAHLDRPLGPQRLPGQVLGRVPPAGGGGGGGRAALGRAPPPRGPPGPRGAVLAPPPRGGAGGCGGRPVGPPPPPPPPPRVALQRPLPQ